jgi:hypothetical protein
MLYLQIELPALRLKWHRNNGVEMLCSVIRTNYSKPSLLSIPSVVQGVNDFEVSAIDMKIHNQETIEPYKEFRYGDGVMVASRMGTPFNNLEKYISCAYVIGVSVNPTSWSAIALDFFKYAKHINPNIIIIVGGTDPFFRDEYYLNSGVVDFVIRGEAEVIIPELLKALKSKMDYSKIPGISFLNKGQIVKNPKCSFLNLDQQPLDALNILKNDIPLWTEPIEYFPMPKEVSKPIGIVFFTRGCSESCDFCTTPLKMGKFRFLSLEKIQEKVEHFKSFGINTLNIWDDSISSVLRLHPLGYAAGKKYLIDIIGILWENEIAFEFSQGIVIKHLWDADKNEPDFDLINTLYSNSIVDGKFVGCYAEYFPTECLQVDNRYEKLMSFEKEKDVLKAILKAGTNTISFSSIMGSIEDNKESFITATKRLNELKDIVELNGGKALATPFIFSIFPGTKVWTKYQNLIEYDIMKYPELYQLNTAVHRTNSFLPHEITLAKKEMERNVLSEQQFLNWNRTGRYQWL